MLNRMIFNLVNCMMAVWYSTIVIFQITAVQKARLWPI